jgi:retron-type reverse transcriptase
MFEQIIALENLFDAWEEFRKDKAKRMDVMKFEFNLENNIFALHDDLKTEKYQHGEYTAFSICDPKPRRIHKAIVRDRLLHHAIIRIIEPAWDRFFIFDSWSSRKGKGVHGAVGRLERLALRLSHNHKKTLWVLKMDIKSFFASIGHEILLDILKEKTPDVRLVHLLQNIINSFHRGLPLGNLTSQLFANIYLNKLDQFIKHKLKIKGYIRYADDLFLMSQDKKYLINCALKIEIFLRDFLRLKIHPNKIILKTYASGIDCLGYVCFPYYRILRTKTKKRMFKRINLENFPSYLGVLRHCRSNKLRINLLQTLDGH